MKVYELIKELCQFDANAEVIVNFESNTEIEISCDNCEEDISVEIPKLSGREISVAGGRYNAVISASE